MGGVRTLDEVTRLNAAILGRVPFEHHAEVVAIQAAITQICESARESTEAHAFVNGVKTAEQRETDGRESGFQAGYRDGLEQAWGPVDSPARREHENDPAIHT